MGSQEVKVAAGWIVGLLALATVWGLGGCQEGEQTSDAERPVVEPRLSDIYTATVLGRSNSLDVLEMVKQRPDELLSQSDSVVASQGEDKKGLRLWFTMVAFDEHSMKAARKYFFLVDENVKKAWFGKSKQGMVFHCQAVLPADVGQKPYEDENAKTRAIVGYVQKAFGADVDGLGEDVAAGAPDARRLGVSGLMVNQALRDVVVRIGGSPVLAGRLGSPQGLEFDHPNFEKGTARISVQGDTANLSIEMGVPAAQYGGFLLP